MNAKWHLDTTSKSHDFYFGPSVALQANPKAKLHSYGAFYKWSAETGTTAGVFQVGKWWYPAVQKAVKRKEGWRFEHYIDIGVIYGDAGGAALAWHPQTFETFRTQVLPKW